MNKKRMAGNYEIINAIHIGDKEIVLGVDMNNADGHYYYVADCERNEIFELFNNAVVGDNFIEIAEVYSDRLKEQIEKVKAENKGYPDTIITADMCESKYDKNLEGEIIVIKADVLRPEYRAEAHQIVRCTGGHGARADARGNAVFCSYLASNKRTRFERYDVLGILKKEHYPKWLTEKLSREKSAKPKNDMER